jgi:hypothetical protein
MKKEIPKKAHWGGIIQYSNIEDLDRASEIIRDHLEIGLTFLEHQSLDITKLVSLLSHMDANDEKLLTLPIRKLLEFSVKSELTWFPIKLTDPLGYIYNKKVYLANGTLKMMERHGDKAIELWHHFDKRDLKRKFKIIQVHNSWLESLK